MKNRIWNSDDEVTLELLVDKYGMASTLEQLADICSEKAEHIHASYQDKPLAESWELACGSLSMAARDVNRLVGFLERKGK